MGEQEAEGEPGISAAARAGTGLGKRSLALKNWGSLCFTNVSSLQVLSESSKSSGYRLFSYARHSSEGKQSGLGRKHESPSFLLPLRLD